MPISRAPAETKASRLPRTSPVPISRSPAEAKGDWLRPRMPVPSTSPESKPGSGNFLAVFFHPPSGWTAITTSYCRNRRVAQRARRRRSASRSSLVPLQYAHKVVRSTSTGLLDEEQREASRGPGAAMSPRSPTGCRRNPAGMRCMQWFAPLLQRQHPDASTHSNQPTRADAEHANRLESSLFRKLPQAKAIDTTLQLPLRFFVVEFTSWFV